MLGILDYAGNSLYAGAKVLAFRDIDNTGVPTISFGTVVKAIYDRTSDNSYIVSIKPDLKSSIQDSEFFISSCDCVIVTDNVDLDKFHEHYLNHNEKQNVAGKCAYPENSLHIDPTWLYSIEEAIEDVVLGNYVLQCVSLTRFLAVMSEKQQCFLDMTHDEVLNYFLDFEQFYSVNSNILVFHYKDENYLCRINDKKVRIKIKDYLSYREKLCNPNFVDKNHEIIEEIVKNIQSQIKDDYRNCIYLPFRWILKSIDNFTRISARPIIYLIDKKYQIGNYICDSFSTNHYGTFLGSKTLILKKKGN